ncbi:DUF1569 domain-containing protein [Flavobacterium sp.]|jgi:hypothetical protein|uniref:DUF1569 domain-containing protein n=1 Tax=Flavobacterium sp. TaxID=239 RepID=UPI0037BF67F1
MNKLKSVLDELESHIIDFEKTNVAVSQSSIGWHIDHSLIVINSIVAQLKNSNPQEYKWKFNWKRTYIQTINKFPRGKGKAPKAVQPTETSSIEVLNSKLEIANKRIIELENLESNNFFMHPYFGNLNLKTSIWLLELHTKHHLEIIKDIKV